MKNIHTSPVPVGEKAGEHRLQADPKSPFEGQALQGRCRDAALKPANSPPPAGYDETTPYTVALVKLEEGPLVTAQLTDLGDQPIEIGMPVEMVTRRLRQDGDERGMLIYTLKGAGR